MYPKTQTPNKRIKSACQSNVGPLVYPVYPMAIVLSVGVELRKTSKENKEVL